MAYLALQLADLEGSKEFPGLVAVADVLEGLRGVLARNVKQDLLATTKDHVSLSANAVPTYSRKRACENNSKERGGVGKDSRVLVDKLGDVVDSVMDDQVEVILGVVLRNVLVGELGGHLHRCFVGVMPREKPRRVGWDSGTRLV